MAGWEPPFPGAPGSQEYYDAWKKAQIRGSAEAKAYRLWQKRFKSREDLDYDTYKAQLRSSIRKSQRRVVKPAQWRMALRQTETEEYQEYIEMLKASTIPSWRRQGELLSTFSESHRQWRINKDLEMEEVPQPFPGIYEAKKRGWVEEKDSEATVRAKALDKLPFEHTGPLSPEDAAVAHSKLGERSRIPWVGEQKFITPSGDLADTARTIFDTDVSYYGESLAQTRFDALGRDYDPLTTARPDTAGAFRYIEIPDKVESVEPTTGTAKGIAWEGNAPRGSSIAEVIAEEGRDVYSGDVEEQIFDLHSWLQGSSDPEDLLSAVLQRDIRGFHELSIDPLDPENQERIKEFARIRKEVEETAIRTRYVGNWESGYSDLHGLFDSHPATILPEILSRQIESTGIIGENDKTVLREWFATNWKSEAHQDRGGLERLDKNILLRSSVGPFLQNILEEKASAVENERMRLLRLTSSRDDEIAKIRAAIEAKKKGGPPVHPDQYARLSELYKEKKALKRTADNLQYDAGKEADITSSERDEGAYLPEVEGAERELDRPVWGKDGRRHFKGDVREFPTLAEQQESIANEARRAERNIYNIFSLGDRPFYAANGPDTGARIKILDLVNMANLGDTTASTVKVSIPSLSDEKIGQASPIGIQYIPYNEPIAPNQSIRLVTGQKPPEPVELLNIYNRNVDDSQFINLVKRQGAGFDQSPTSTLSMAIRKVDEEQSRNIRRAVSRTIPLPEDIEEKLPEITSQAKEAYRLLVNGPIPESPFRLQPEELSPVASYFRPSAVRRGAEDFTSRDIAAEMIGTVHLSEDWVKRKPYGEAFTHIMRGQDRTSAEVRNILQQLVGVDEPLTDSFKDFVSRIEESSVSDPIGVASNRGARVAKIWGQNQKQLEAESTMRETISKPSRLFGGEPSSDDDYIEHSENLIGNRLQGEKSAYENIQELEQELEAAYLNPDFMESVNEQLKARHISYIERSKAERTLRISRDPVARESAIAKLNEMRIKDRLLERELEDGSVLEKKVVREAWEKNASVRLLEMGNLHINPLANEFSDEDVLAAHSILSRGEDLRGSVQSSYAENVVNARNRVLGIRARGLESWRAAQAKRVARITGRPSRPRNDGSLRPGGYVGDFIDADWAGGGFVENPYDEYNEWEAEQAVWKMGEASDSTEPVADGIKRWWQERQRGAWDRHIVPIFNADVDRFNNVPMEEHLKSFPNITKQFFGDLEEHYDLPHDYVETLLDKLHGLENNPFAGLNETEAFDHLAGLEGMNVHLPMVDFAEHYRMLTGNIKPNPVMAIREVKMLNRPDLSMTTSQEERLRAIAEESFKPKNIAVSFQFPEEMEREDQITHMAAMNLQEIMEGWKRKPETRRFLERLPSGQLTPEAIQAARSEADHRLLGAQDFQIKREFEWYKPGSQRWHPGRAGEAEGVIRSIPEEDLVGLESKYRDLYRQAILGLNTLTPDADMLGNPIQEGDVIGRMVDRHASIMMDALRRFGVNAGQKGTKDLGGIFKIVDNSPSMMRTQSAESMRVMMEHLSSFTGPNTVTEDRLERNVAIANHFNNWINTPRLRMTDAAKRAVTVTNPKYMPIVKGKRLKEEDFAEEIGLIDEALKERGLSWAKVKEVSETFEGKSYDISKRNTTLSEAKREAAAKVLKFESFGGKAQPDFRPGELHSPMAMGDFVNVPGLGDVKKEKGMRFGQLFGMHLRMAQMDKAELIKRGSDYKIDVTGWEQYSEDKIRDLLFKHSGGYINLDPNVSRQLLVEHLASRTEAMFDPHIQDVFKEAHKDRFKRVINSWDEREEGIVPKSAFEIFNEVQKKEQKSKEVRTIFTQLNLKTIRKAWDDSNSFKAAAIGAAAIAAIGGISLLRARRSKPDHTAEDIAGPPYMPGSNPYGEAPFSPNVTPSLPDVGSPQPFPGMDYVVRANGDFNPDKFRGQVGKITGTGVGGSNYTARRLPTSRGNMDAMMRTYGG